MHEIIHNFFIKNINISHWYSLWHKIYDNIIPLHTCMLNNLIFRNTFNDIIYKLY